MGLSILELLDPGKSCVNYTDAEVAQAILEIAEKADLCPACYSHFFKLLREGRWRDALEHFFAALPRSAKCFEQEAKST